MTTGDGKFGGYDVADAMKKFDPSKMQEIKLPPHPSVKTNKALQQGNEISREISERLAAIEERASESELKKPAFWVGVIAMAAACIAAAPVVQEFLKPAPEYVDHQDATASSLPDKPSGSSLPPQTPASGK